MRILNDTKTLAFFDPRSALTVAADRTGKSANTVLLTPGPLTTSAATRRAMDRDWGSRDADFIALTAAVRRRLCALANAVDSHACVPIQGSGTFAVEAMLGSLVPANGKVLIAINGAYGERMARICGRLGRDAVTISGPETEPVAAAMIDSALADDRGLTHVAVVHCETTAGVLNPLAEIAAVVADRKRALLVDAMSALGALPVDAGTIAFAGLAASANKCLEGVPGMAFVLATPAALDAGAGAAPSLSLDLHDQWRGFENNGQWRFTPPTHVVAALAAALDQLDREGGPPARLQRYRRNCTRLIQGMRALGFTTLVDDAHQAPIIVSFRTPAHPAFDFERLYQEMHGRGFAIYPGKLTMADSFRIGCIGAIDNDTIEAALTAMKDTLVSLKIVLNERVQVKSDGSM